MRVKSFLAAAGCTVVAAVVAVPGMSNASRLPNPGPSVATAAAPAVADTPAPQPAVTTTTTTAPPVAEPTMEPQPVVTTTTTTAPAPPPVVKVRSTAPADDTPTGAEDSPVTVDTKKVDPPAPTGDTGNDAAVPAGPPADPCHMDSYQPVKIGTLTDQGEITRAGKVNRNGNEWVCRKDIPGRGRGNTGNGTNIKDDQAG